MQQILNGNFWTEETGWFTYEQFMQFYNKNKVFWKPNPSLELMLPRDVWNHLKKYLSNDPTTFFALSRTCKTIHGFLGLFRTKKDFKMVDKLWMDRFVLTLNKEYCLNTYFFRNPKYIHIKDENRKDYLVQLQKEDSTCTILKVQISSGIIFNNKNYVMGFIYNSSAVLKTALSSKGCTFIVQKKKTYTTRKTRKLKLYCSLTQ